MAKLSVRDLKPGGKRVFVRVDYNVPIEEKNSATLISDDTRIRETLPTLRLLLEQGARLILAAHLGRPNGKREAALSLKPVAQRLGALLGKPVAFVDECVGPEAESAAASVQNGQALLLENVRFHAGEETNDPVFSAQLARMADVYINDAFGAAHRAHASTSGVPRIVHAWGGPCATGLLMERELRFLGGELDQPARPFVVVLGGAKVSDKIKVIDRLLDKADAVLIGGAMAYTFKLAHGGLTGKSMVEKDHTDTALRAESKAKSRGISFRLPVDTVVATLAPTGKLNKKGKPIHEIQNPRVVEGDIPDDSEGFDIGPKTAAEYAAVIAGAGTVLWNGPMGMFEDARFAKGTVLIAQALAEATKSHGTKSIIGGGDCVTAVRKAGLGEQMTFMSTGGGAALEFLEGIELPGLMALDDK